MIHSTRPHVQRSSRKCNSALPRVPHWTNARSALGVASLFVWRSLLGLSGCAAVKVKLGMRVYLRHCHPMPKSSRLASGADWGIGEIYEAVAVVDFYIEQN
jgi:hypothetical protein